MTGLWTTIAILYTLCLALAFTAVSLYFRARHHKKNAEHLESELAETMKLLGEATQTIIAGELEAKESAEYDPSDPLTIANPVFTIREWFTVGHSLAYVDKHVAYTELEAYINTLLHNGGRFMVIPPQTAAEDREGA